MTIAKNMIEALIVMRSMIDRAEECLAIAGLKVEIETFASEEGREVLKKIMIVDDNTLPTVVLRKRLFGPTFDVRVTFDLDGEPKTDEEFMQSDINMISAVLSCAKGLKEIMISAVLDAMEVDKEKTVRMINELDPDLANAFEQIRAQRAMRQPGVDPREAMMRRAEMQGAKLLEINATNLPEELMDRFLEITKELAAHQEAVDEAAAGSGGPLTIAAGSKATN